jgi:2-keto-4-pentenoate hydratase/2-oxohepta-3-ene-1,7-dioic acid hydratase in catechol pathway
MRLARFGTKGAEQPGVIDAAGRLRSLVGVTGDLSNDALSPAGLERIGNIAADSLPLVEDNPHLWAPIAGIGKIIGVGLNYRDHAEECALPLPSEPTLFLKATSAIAGPHDGLVIPRGAQSVDWEVELGVVIGVAGVYIDERRAMEHIAGYCVGIDFSERDFQFRRGGQGFKGKSADSFAPLGPWLVTRDEISDPHRLTLRLSVNDVERQHGTTADMIFSIPQLVSYVSQFMSLQPGDVILTGTPAGVGMGQDPKVYLRPGDEVRATIDGLGAQHHRVLAAVSSGVPSNLGLSKVRPA